MAPDKVSFMLGGEPYTLTIEQLSRATKGIVPESVCLHVVEVKGVEYPMKQVFAEVTGLDRLDFTTNQARRQLKKLGFKLSRSE